MRWLISLVVLLLLGGGAVSAQQTQPLLQQANLRYLGSFLVQNVANDPARWTGYGLYAMSADGETLYFGGVDTLDRMCRARIPTDLSGGATAQLVGACFRLNGINNLADIDSDRVNPVGSLIVNHKLIVAAHIYYDASGSAKRSHQRMNLDGTGQLSGFHTIGNFGAGQIAGPMAHIPPEWQPLLGGLMCGGGGGYSIVGRTSYGPSCYVFDPNLIGSGAVPATRLMAFTQDHPACGTKGCDAGSSPANPYFNWTTKYHGSAIPAGYRTFLVQGVHGSGPSCYGEPWECPGGSGYKGPHAPPYVQRVWLYDLAHLAEVKTGKRQAWDLRPYAHFDLKEPTPGRYDERFGGAAYDPQTRRLYVGDVAGNNSERPRVHVYEITGAAPPPPEEICGDGIDNDKDGQIDEGCPVACEVGPWVQVSESPWSQCFAGPPSFQTRTTLWRRTVTVPERHDGGACGALEEDRSETQACTVTPPPVTSITVKGTIAIDPIMLGPGKYLFVVLTEYGPVTFEFPGLRIPGAVRDLRKGDFVEITPSLNPILK